MTHRPVYVQKYIVAIISNPDSDLGMFYRNKKWTGPRIIIENTCLSASEDVWTVKFNDKFWTANCQAIDRSLSGIARVEMCLAQAFTVAHQIASDYEREMEEVLAEGGMPTIGVINQRKRDAKYQDVLRNIKKGEFVS